jgi:energy-coupling factor transport system substrate-specific component
VAPSAPGTTPVRSSWLRVLIALAATVATALIGVTAAGVFAPSPNPDELPPGANLLMLVLAISLLAGFVVYAAIEWLQTRRLDSIAHQFDTRTIVLIPFAIAINVVLGQTVAVALKVPVYLDSIGTIVVGVLAGPFAGAATGLLSNLAWTFLLAGTPVGSPFAWPFAIVAAEIGLLAGAFGYAGVFRPRPGTPRDRFAVGLAVGAVVLAALVWYGIVPQYRDLCPDAATPGPGCLSLFQPTEAIPPAFLVIALGFVALLLVTLAVLFIRLVARRDLGVVFVLVAGATCGVVSAFIAAPIAAYLFAGVTGSGTDFLVLLFQSAGSSLQDAVLKQSLISDPIDKTITFLVVYALLGAASRRLTARFPQGERALGRIEA